MKNKNKILYIVIACVILIGAIVIGAKGFNVALKYTANKQINVYIGKEFDGNEIRNITKKVTGSKDVIVQKVEVYEEIASITVKDITDEQVSELNDKINEKYEIENKVGEGVVVTENARIRLRDLVKNFIFPIALSLVIILVYAGIRFRKLDIFEVLGKILGLNILAEMTYASILAITRLPINALTVPIAVAIYLIVTLVIFNELETEERNVEQEENKKRKNNAK